MADHLFSPGAPPKPLRIEYTGPLYDGDDWDTYPSRQGWESAPNTPKFPPRRIPPEFHPYIECWLYFGTLHYVFGDTLDQNDFLVCEGEKQYITTKHLPRYIENTRAWKKRNRGTRSIEIVSKVCKVLPLYYNTIRPPLRLAIQLLSHALWNIATTRDPSLPAQPPHVRTWMFAQPSEVETMVGDGWCPLDAEKCRKAGGEVDTAAYLLQLVRTKADWNKRSHEACRKTECVADNVDESVYVTRHVDGRCNCQHVHADVEALHAILKEGDIPIVEIARRPSGGGYEIAVARRQSRRYVAVSHVWADGLGNPASNSLPHCQIELLYARAKTLLSETEYVPQYENGPFGALHSGAARLAHFAGRRAEARRGEAVLVWIDTLCIPHGREVRGLAITRIRDVYVRAYRTMLLDSEIRQLASTASALELVLRVLYCSGWIRRLWTLQEGLAAKSRLYVLLSDKAVNISTMADSLFTKLDQGKIPIFQARIARFAAGVWYSYFQHTIDAASKFEKFVNVMTSPFIDASISQDQLVAWNWFNVATRASSKDGDRPVVLAGVLDLDVGAILKVKGAHERMRVFYSLLDGFPADVLFQDGLRFEEDGWRWALRVCRYTDEIRYLGHGAGRITEGGLQVTGVLSWVFESSVVFDLRRLEEDDGQLAWEAWLDAAQIDPDKPAKVLHLKAKQDVCFPADEVQGILLEEVRTSRPGSATRCALVSLQARDEEVHYARYTSVATVQSVDLGLSSFPDEGFLIGGTWDDLQRREWVVG
ncbi:uncharacterized protein DSM5745_10705 [Aspergillus mulundensis]|uniref:Heterokaryon incompatibility domain-containing protein n=1 Tax=Aspergillus mulundensis TaxID=1810919 RepID=A0A3D8QHJ0_9EURO|nr:Uncharacterized protein DSM5745_10705 [Aspergillus mulundensis]RDW61207.1 Uncharacterized protein DSM5745_10705 [Aspergillus mulundensis]